MSIFLGILGSVASVAVGVFSMFADEEKNKLELENKHLISRLKTMIVLAIILFVLLAAAAIFFFIKFE